MTSPKVCLKHGWGDHWSSQCPDMERGQLVSREPTPRVVWCAPDGSWGETALDTPIIQMPSSMFTLGEMEEMAEMGDGARYDYMRGKYAITHSDPDMFGDDTTE